MSVLNTCIPISDHMVKSAQAVGGMVSRNVISFLFILLILTMNAESKKESPPCSVCKEIIKNFNKGLESTAKSNYGGGNTKWEEKSLGSYATSEVRLVEIVEHLCQGSSKECHSMLEEHEEHLERYWFKEFGQKKDTDLHTYFCIEHIKACCPNNTYGKECLPCTGGVERPCSDNGRCDGEGTRSGTGKCHCDSGYKGDLCNECKDGHYEESKNDTHAVCKVCHISCKNTCLEGGPKGCDECKTGWSANEELGCQDINECTDDPCTENQYCTNTQGSYTCFSCDEACESCTGSGPAACNECSSGYILNEETKVCTDVNECENDSTLCTEENQECKNKPGSYECVCMSGFGMKDGVCQSVPKERVISSKPLSGKGANLAEQWKNKQRRQNELDWSKFKDNPSVVHHFLVMGLYGLGCIFARNSPLAMGALSTLMTVHVVWFSTNSK